MAWEEPYPSARDEGQGKTTTAPYGAEDRSTARLLSALSHVRAGRDQSWTARCPAHQDRSPSLSIRALPDGRVLIHCFSGCSAGEVVAAVGMELRDLMPPRPRDTSDGPGGHAPLPVAWRSTKNLLAEAAHEALIVVLAMESEWRGEDLSLADEDRVFEAVRRLRRFAYDTR